MTASELPLLDTSKPLRLPYQEVRELIYTGDLIALRSRKGWLPWAIRLITRSPYTHTGIAMWVGGRLLIAETRGGPASLVPLSQYEPHDFDVFDAPTGADTIYGRDVILCSLGHEIDYSYLDLVRVALHELVRLPLPKPSDDEMICSALSAVIYRRMGWKPQGLPRIPTPRDLVKALGKAARIEVRRRG